MNQGRSTPRAASETAAPAGRSRGRDRRQSAGPETTRLAPRALLFAVGILFLPPASALTFNVDAFGDAPDATPGDGICADATSACTLRAAVMEGNASAGPHVINLPAGTYTLTIPSGSSDTDASVGDLDLTTDTWTFSGAGAGQTIIDGATMNHRVFEVPVNVFFSGSVTFSDLTIRGGNSSGLGSFYDAGAAVRIGSRFASLVRFERVEITGNTGATAIYTLADTEIDSSTVSNNSGTGLFQTNDGSTPLANVRTLDISDSTFEGNGGSGIAIGNNDGGSLINSTVSGNGASGFLAQFTGAVDFYITHSTIANNGLDGVSGIGYEYLGTPVRPQIVVRSSIIDDNARSDVTTPALEPQAEIPSSEGFNIVSDNSAAVHFTWPTDLNNTDPMLVPIALNAPGATRTHALMPGSPAIDHAGAVFAPATDQRGVSRPQGAGPDSGSYEFVPKVADLAVSKTAGVSEAERGDTVEFTVVVSNSGPDPVVDAAFADTPDANFTAVSWTCIAGAGGTCSGSGNGAISDSIGLPNGVSVTYTIQATIAPTAQGTAINSASVIVPAGTSDPVASNDQDSAAITIVITNVSPTANDDSFALDEDDSGTIDVADNDTDTDGNLDPSTTNTSCGTCSTPAQGSLVSNGDGTFDYTPIADYFGPDSFVYEICDTDAACDTATVTITVDPVNDAPSFDAGADPVFAAGTSGPQAISSWPQNVDLGPNETQQIDSFAVVTISDPDSVLSSAAAISAAGELTFALSGNSGTALLEATLTDDGGTANGGDDTSAAVAFSITVEPPSADVRVSILRCTDLAAPDAVYVYGLRAVNDGPDASAGVALTHTPIPGATVTSVSSPDCLDTGTAVDCDLGTLAPGAEVEIGLQIQAPPGGAQVLTMSADVAATTNDPKLSNNADQADVEIVPGLVVADGFESCGN